MDYLEKFNELKKTIEENEKKKIRIDTQIEENTKNLELEYQQLQEFDLESIEDAESKIDQLKEELDEVFEQWNKLIN